MKTNITKMAKLNDNIQYQNIVF